MMHITQVVKHIAKTLGFRMSTDLIFVGSYSATSYQPLTPT